MKGNNQVIIERDMHCPYCGGDSAVLISETVKSKKLIGCAPIGLKDGCLICLTGGCWTLISGLPLCHIKEENDVNLYGFCPCCGNSYPVLKPSGTTQTTSDSFQTMKQKTFQVIDRAKDMMGRGKGRDANFDDRLRELHRQFSEGEITQDEYESRKQMILDSIQ